MELLFVLPARGHHIVLCKVIMNPMKDRHATLVDLLDRMLDKGIVINADIIISIAGVPLIGVNLRAALASMETMVKYGVMQAWDEKIREDANKAELKKTEMLSS